MRLKYLSLGIGSFLLVMCSALIAKGVSAKGIGFFAPNVSGILSNPSTVVGTPEAGAIVFDISNSTFYGNAGTPTSPSWVSMNAAASLVPSGAILPFGGTSAPTGYLLCDGSAVSRTTYSALFAAIGTAYGVGDGSTTFNLPDLRGRFVRGVDGGSGNDPDASSRTAMNGLGGNTGDNVGSYQVDALGPHSHNLGATAFVQFGGANLWGGGSGMGTITATTNSGTGIGSETRPVNVYVNYIIKQ